ncbi:MAG: hypothetical protein HUU02_08005 [Bacteroidetes bacterium]|nr:hypothetical protein [Bacteroidota bacterium]
MKKNLSFLSAIVMVTLLMFTGCKEDETTAPVDTSIPSDVFPLTAGRQFVYNGWFTNADTETPIPNTNLFYRTSWTVLKADTPLVKVFGPLYIAAKSEGKTSSALVLDSTLTSPTGPYKLTPVAAYQNPTTNDYYYMTNLGYFYRSLAIKTSSTDTTYRNDSLRFIKLASPSVGLGASFVCFEETFTTYPSGSQIKLKITGTWGGSTENVTVNGTTYTTYPIVIARAVTSGTNTLSSGVTAKIWLAKGIGPVKMFLAGDPETPGNYRELKSKNF